MDSFVYHLCPAFDRRKSYDRRKDKTKLKLKYMLKGNRENNRRKEELDIGYYVDRHSPLLFVILISIVVMSVCDAIFTLIHLSNGAIEINPVMDIAISRGSRYFFFVKYSLTAFGLIMLCIYKNFSHTKKAISFIFITYFILTIYHIVGLLSKF